MAVSWADPFQAGEQITDPNTGFTRTEPSSNDVLSAAAQRLTPPSPASVPEPTPTHIVDHLSYSPADFNGNASYQLPFDLSAGLPAISGYRLKRAPPTRCSWPTSSGGAPPRPACSTTTRSSRAGPTW